MNRRILLRCILVLGVLIALLRSTPVTADPGPPRPDEIGAPQAPAASDRGVLAPGYCSSSGGSTQYESIRSVNLKPKSNNTLELTVEVFIANPNGCQSGEPCPQYDDSPENVNAWIDWNGDKVWAPTERVMDKALTGYGSINYGGSMTAVSQIPIPEGVTTTTWMRTNLAWNDDANDPCRTSWSWGMVVDRQVSVKPPVIKQIKVKGQRDVNNPMTTFSVILEAELETAVGYEVTKVSWTGDLTPGEGNPYTYTPDKGTHGKKKIKATVSYRHVESGLTGQVSKEHEFKLFFRKDGDEDGDGNVNWFEYWGRDGAVPGLTAGDVQYDAAKSGYGSWSNSTDKLTLGPLAAATHYPTTLSIPAATNCPGGTFGGAKGIDSVAEVIAHERQHETFWENWNRNGTWTIGTTVDSDDPTANNKSDVKGDMMPDAYETGTSGTNPNDLDSCDLETRKSAVYKWYGDEEFMTIKAGHGKTGVAAKDWANPGKQSNPPFAGAVAAAAAPSEQRSGPAATDLSYRADAPILPDLATLSGQYTDAGVDTDGDSLFDLLRMTVGVNVNAPGIYGVIGRLFDGSDTEIGWAVATASLAAGPQTLALEFDGVLIRQHGVAGPYHLKQVEVVTGDRDDLVDAADDAHTTAAYGVDAFARPAVTVTGSFSDRGVDDGGDVGFERLEIETNVQVNEAGVYTLLGWLHTTDGETLPGAVASAEFAASGSVILAFDGANLGRQRADGPYRLRGLEVRTAQGDRVSYTDLAYTTGAYTADQFQGTSTGILHNSFSDSGLDVDGDGQYDYLEIAFQINAEAPGDVTVSAHLAVDERSTIATVEQAVTLAAGETAVTLHFPGGAIRRSGADGPYLATNLTILAADGALLDARKVAYTTGTYAADDFDTPLVALTDSYADRAVDTDGDGRNDQLEITVGIAPGNDGTVQIQGWLADSTGTLFSQAEAETAVTAGQATTLALVFDADVIAAHGVDGPYELHNLLVFHAGDPNQAVDVPVAHRTAAYRASDLTVLDNAAALFLPLVVRNPAAWDPCNTPPTGESDNVADAIYICSGQRATGRVGLDDRDDVYRFEAAAGQHVVITLSGSGGDVDLYLYPPGTIDVTSDPWSASSRADGNDERLDGTVQVTGVWYIDVFSYAGSTDYTLTLDMDGAVQAAETFSLPADSGGLRRVTRD